MYSEMLEAQQFGSIYSCSKSRTGGVMSVRKMSLSSFKNSWFLLELFFSKKKQRIMRFWIPDFHEWKTTNKIMKGESAPPGETRPSGSWDFRGGAYKPGLHIPPLEILAGCKSSLSVRNQPSVSSLSTSFQYKTIPFSTAAVLVNVHHPTLEFYYRGVW